METLSDRKTSTRRPLVLVVLFLGLFVAVCVGAVYYAGDLANYQELISAEESRTALRDVSDPKQLEQVLKRYPSNKILKLVALANQGATELDAAARRLLHEAEPIDLSKPVDLSASSRSDLEALREEMKTAEERLATLRPHYATLVKAESDKLENEARALNIGSDTLSRFKTMLDQQNAEMIDLTSNMLAARAGYYKAYQQSAALLVREFGMYKVVDGQFIFPFQPAADSYNRAAAAMTDARRRIGELENQWNGARQSRLTRWKNFVDRRAAGKGAA